MDHYVSNFVLFVYNLTTDTLMASVEAFVRWLEDVYFLYTQLSVREKMNVNFLILRRKNNIRYVPEIKKLYCY